MTLFLQPLILFRLAMRYRNFSRHYFAEYFMTCGTVMYSHTRGESLRKNGNFPDRWSDRMDEKEFGQQLFEQFIYYIVAGMAGGVDSDSDSDSHQRDFLSSISRIFGCRSIPW